MPDGLPRLEGESANALHPAAPRGVCARARADVHRTLLEVSRATASHRDLESLLRDLTGVLQRVAPFDVLRLVLHDPERDVMRLHTLAAIRPVTTTVLELPTAGSPAGVAMRTQQPVVVPNVDHETRFSNVTGILRAEGMKSFCAIPLTSPLRRLGALHFASHEEDAFGEADVAFLQELSRQVALAVDNTLHHEAAHRAREELARERDRLQLLLEVNNTLVSNLDWRALFSAISSCLRRVVAHEYTSLAVYDGDRNGFDMWAIEFPGELLIKEYTVVPVEGSPAGGAFTAGGAVAIRTSGSRGTRLDVGRLMLAEGIQSMFTVPLTVHGRRLGTLGIGRVGGEPFTDSDVELLASVPNQVAFAVENVLAFQEIAELKAKLAAEKVYLKDEIRTEYNFEEILGRSSALRRVLDSRETINQDKPPGSHSRSDRAIRETAADFPTRFTYRLFEPRGHHAADDYVAFRDRGVSARGVNTSARPMRRSSSARTRSNTMFTTSAPSCIGSTCTRNGRFPKGVSASLAITSATAETSASRGTIDAKPSLRSVQPTLPTLVRVMASAVPCLPFGKVGCGTDL